VKLEDLMVRAVYDQELRRLLFEVPDRAAAEYGLDAEDRGRLLSTSRADLDSAVGKLILHMLVPTRLSESLIVAPENGLAVDPRGQMAIIIDQSLTGANIGTSGTSENEGRVFGSGTHPTTRLCAHMLEKYLTPCKRVLDLGTGSGILALAAAKLGASEVVGLDVDANAIQLAEANARRNGLNGKVRFFLGDATWPAANGKAPFDLIVSNILAGVHFHSLAQGLVSSIAPCGMLILSGMHENGAARVAQAVVRDGCKIVDQARIRPWHVLVARAPGHR
jgi:ribosomal protein L11 methylase PrmA